MIVKSQRYNIKQKVECHFITLLKVVLNVLALLLVLVYLHYNF